jgi:hypothetical protein
MQRNCSYKQFYSHKSSDPISGSFFAFAFGSSRLDFILALLGLDFFLRIILVAFVVVLASFLLRRRF